MRNSKKIHSVIIISLLMIIFISNTFGEDYIKYFDKDDVGAPVSKDAVTKLDFAVVTDLSKIIYPFSDYIYRYCMKYEQIVKNELNSMIRKMADTPYSIDDYFQVKECEVRKAGERKSPMIHLTAEAPCSRVEYPEIIHKYYTVKRNASDLWLKIINNTNSQGETFLDYIDFLDHKNIYNTTDTKKCANQMIAFACKHGAVYLKSNKTCPSGI